MDTKILDRKIADLAIIMSPQSDQVAIAKENIEAGTRVALNGSTIEIKDYIRKGQRFALRSIAPGEFVRQYGYPFGQSKGIKAGELISPENLDNVVPEADEKKFNAPVKTSLQAKYQNKTFLGYPRKDGRVGTRNYYLVVPTSMCVSEISLQVATFLDNNPETLKDYPNIDAIVAIPHTEGCGCDTTLQIERFMRVIKSFVRHPNVGGCLLVDLGCEQTNYERMNTHLKSTLEENLKPIDWITVQKSGGTVPTIEGAKRIILNRLKEVNAIKRQPFSLGKLVVGTECGSSDSFSGITANPIIGNVADKVIYGGGAAILSEMPEMLGTLGMLLPRFRSLEVVKKFREKLQWYEDLAKRMGYSLAGNLVPKNIAGGLINLYVKSLGAVLKGGTTTIEDVVEYAEPIKTQGLSIMQGPGSDLESVTGIVASGATVMCFSTGNGTPTGNAICPIIKISSNDTTFRNMREDMDFNAGRLVSENRSIDDLGEELLEKVSAVASGEKTWSEKWKQRQFQVWTAGKLSM